MLNEWFRIFEPNYCTWLVAILFNQSLKDGVCDVSIDKKCPYENKSGFIKAYLKHSDINQCNRNGLWVCLKYI